MSQDLLTAVHEAGHVSGHLLYMEPFRYVTLRPKSDADGHVVLGRSKTIGRTAAVVCSLTGPMAEARFRGFDGGAMGDLWKIMREDCGGYDDLAVALDYIGEEWDEKLFDRAMNLAWEHVDEHLDPIQALAVELARKRTLTQDECWRIWNGVAA